MAISEPYSGTATVGLAELSLVSGTTTLQSVTIPGVIQLFIDSTNMASGDEYQIKIKDKIISAGAQENLYVATLDGKQDTPFVTASLILYHGWDITLVKISGTDRSFSWSIRKVG